MRKRLPLETQQEIWRLDCQGRSVTEIARMIKRSRHGVANVLARAAARPRRAERVATVTWAFVHGRAGGIRAGLEGDESFTMNHAVHRSSRLDRLAGGRRQTWTRRLSGVAGPSRRRAPGQAPEDPQARRGPFGRQGHRVARGVVVARGDRPPVAPRVSTRSDDVGEPRDHRRVALRPGPR